MCEEITKNSDICKRAAIISGRLGEASRLSRAVHIDITAEGEQ